MTRVAIIGGSGGIGHALLGAISELPDVTDIYGTYFRSAASSSLGSISSFGTHSEVHWSRLDVTLAADVQTWLESIGEIDWIINCAGYLHDLETGPEKSIASFDTDYFEKSMRINCLPTLLLAQHCKDNLKHSERAVFATISAKVGSISDNALGGWYSYRASKAALNMSLKTLSIEWQRTLPNVKVLALHPGTTDTNLSKPFQQNVQPEKLFTVEKTATFLLARLQEAERFDSGRFLAYDGDEIPW